MEQWLLVSIIIAVYLLLTLTIGLMAGRRSSDSVAGYVAADRSFGLFCAGALSASMSTGDALLHASASVVVQDSVTQYVDLDDRAQRRLMRVIVVLTGGTAYFFAGSGFVVGAASRFGLWHHLAARATGGRRDVLEEGDHNRYDGRVGRRHRNGVVLLPKPRIQAFRHA